MHNPPALDGEFSDLFVGGNIGEDALLGVENGAAAIRRLVHLAYGTLRCEGFALLIYGEQGDPWLHCEPEISGDLSRVLIAHCDAATNSGSILLADRANLHFPDESLVRRVELQPLRSSTGSLAGVAAALHGSGDLTFAPCGDALRRFGTIFEDHLNLMRIGVRDYLTGLYNRRYFDEMANREWLRARRNALPVSVLIADVDHFKAYNDSLGHQAGDRTLRNIANCLADTFRRSSDVLARYGGEEFSAILPHTNREGGQRAAERLCEAVAGLNIAHPASALGHVTISVGVAVANDSGTLSAGLTPFIQAADAALYSAKRKGRARVEIAA